MVACSCASGKGSPEEYYFNPLKCPLPKAPSMQMFCLYGTNKPTERSYYYLNLESNKACRPPMHTLSLWQGPVAEDMRMLDGGPGWTVAQLGLLLSLGRNTHCCRLSRSQSGSPRLQSSTRCAGRSIRTLPANTTAARCQLAPTHRLFTFQKPADVAALIHTGPCMPGQKSQGGHGK